MPVRIARVRGNASVSFTSGAFQVSLYFAGEIGETLRKMPANGATPQKLIAALLASESAHGAEAYLLIAAILGALRRWEDAALYCTRAVEASAKNSVTVREARFFRGLCLRQTAQARSSDTEAYSRLSAAREDVEAAIASPTRSREGNRDPRYLKELGTIILVWVDQQLPETPGWTLNHALSVLDSARQLVSAEKNEALLIDILNNLCYGFALAGEATLERGLVHLAELESLASAQECSSLAVRDTILLLRAHDARIKRDTAALARLRDAFEDLVSVAEPREHS